MLYINPEIIFQNYKIFLKIIIFKLNVFCNTKHSNLLTVMLRKDSVQRLSVHHSSLGFWRLRCCWQQKQEFPWGHRGSNRGENTASSCHTGQSVTSNQWKTVKSCKGGGSEPQACIPKTNENV